MTDHSRTTFFERWLPSLASGAFTIAVTLTGMAYKFAKIEEKVDQAAALAAAAVPQALFDAKVKARDSEMASAKENTDGKFAAIRSDIKDTREDLRQGQRDLSLKFDQLIVRFTKLPAE